LRPPSLLLGLHGHFEAAALAEAAKCDVENARTGGRLRKGERAAVDELMRKQPEQRIVAAPTPPRPGVAIADAPAVASSVIWNWLSSRPMRTTTNPKGTDGAMPLPR
jgi:hypothetical protein